MKKEGKDQKILISLLVLTLTAAAQAQIFPRQAVSQTPYDPYMNAYRQVVSRGVGAGAPSLEQIENWTSQAYDFRYEHSDAYRAKTPEQVEAAGEGDCKDKSLWLYSKLAAAGVQDIHLVIGQKDSMANEFHAWLYFKHQGQTYIADPTFSGSIQPVAEYGMDEYIPAFSYRGEQAYAYQTAAAGFDPRYQTSIPSIAGQ